jgi:hypothetical protein
VQARRASRNGTLDAVETVHAIHEHGADDNGFAVLHDVAGRHGNYPPVFPTNAHHLLILLLNATLLDVLPALLEIAASTPDRQLSSVSLMK